MSTDAESADSDRKLKLSLIDIVWSTIPVSLWHTEIPQMQSGIASRDEFSGDNMQAHWPAVHAPA